MSARKHTDIVIIAFILLIIFLMPMIFVRVDGEISWRHVIKIWKDNSLLIPLFTINHWVLLPRFIERQQYLIYGVLIGSLVALATFVCHLIDPANIAGGAGRVAPVPPYADMLMYAVLIVGVDLGLYFMKMWQRNEQRRLELERENAKIELEMLRGQVSPHFFMNTLNNIYALVDMDSARAKSSVMKLSKMMRYLLYESGGERVKLSSEFGFIENYIALMRLRYAEGVNFTVDIPRIYHDTEIPPMLFVSYIENAIKHGVSYQMASDIKISFEIGDSSLTFSCTNTIHQSSEQGGIGLKNSKERLDLIFGKSYDLTIDENESLYIVNLIIPLL